MESGDHALRVESYEIIAMPMWVRTLRRVPGMIERSRRDARQGMELTLERIGVIAETETGVGADG